MPSYMPSEQYNRARWYDGVAGRWTAEDPLGFSARDANLVRYVSNSPVDSVDPSGLEETETWYIPYATPVSGSGELSEARPGENFFPNLDAANRARFFRESRMGPIRTYLTWMIAPGQATGNQFCMDNYIFMMGGMAPRAMPGGLRPSQTRVTGAPTGLGGPVILPFPTSKPPPPPSAPPYADILPVTQLGPNTFLVGGRVVRLPPPPPDYLKIFPPPPPSN